MPRKYDSIDLLKLYTTCSTEQWNTWLSACLREDNIEALKQVYYGTQVGMDNLAKQKLNTEKINNWFIRLQRSIEKTLKGILRKKYPNPNDNPLATTAEALEAKRKRDHDFELFLKGARF